MAKNILADAMKKPILNEQKMGPFPTPRIIDIRATELRDVRPGDTIEMEGIVKSVHENGRITVNITTVAPCDMEDSEGEDTNPKTIYVKTQESHVP